MSRFLLVVFKGFHSRNHVRTIRDTTRLNVLGCRNFREHVANALSSSGREAISAAYPMRPYYNKVISYFMGVVISVPLGLKEEGSNVYYRAMGSSQRAS